MQFEQLRRVEADEFNVEWIACPCTTFCDWNLQNGGSRTFDKPVGFPTAKEEVGNTLSIFGAQLFEKALDRGHFPIAESSGVSGRYPKQWNLPQWQRLLQRSDVDFLEVDMCAYGLGPLDAGDKPHFYRHRTGLAFPRHPGFRAALFRLCPGLSDQHHHVPLQGCRPGTTVTRCTEAGVYAPQFAQAVVEALRSFVSVGGGKVPPHLPGRGRAGGHETEDETEETDEEQENQAPPEKKARRSEEAEDAEENEDQRAEDAEVDEEQSVPGSLPEEEAILGSGKSDAGDLPDQEAEADQDDFVYSPSVAPSDLIQLEIASNEPEEDQEEVRSVDSSVERWVSASLRDLAEGNPEDEVGRALQARARAVLEGRPREDSEDDEGGEEEQAETDEERENDSRAGEVERGADEEEDGGSEPPLELAVDQVGGDDWEVDEERGILWIESNVPRHRLISPGGPGSPYTAEQFRSERWTRCHSFNQNDDEPFTQIADDWRLNGSCEGPYHLWTGTTAFVFQGKQVPEALFPWDPVQSMHQHGPEPEPSPGDLPEPSADEENHSEEPNGEQGSPSRQAGGDSTWNDFEEEQIGEETQKAAFRYVEVIDAIEDQEAATWRKVVAAGNSLLQAAGTVEAAAKALWIVREKLGRNNLEGVEDEGLDPLLHPDLRDVRRYGMAARYQGVRERVRTKPHPRARANMDQVFKQLMKDVAKHRVLVADADLPQLSHVVSSPFETVPKMLPNRTLSTEVRLVHDQRQVNTGTDKVLHPPAVQPTHEQIVRRILWLKARFPGVEVKLAKKDVAGAFRLLWVDPRDVELFGGDLPWQPESMGSCSDTSKPGDARTITVLYLVSSFGFSGSPGEWNVWGRATEELHRSHRPQQSRRDGAVHFDGKILVDDMVLVEPVLGLRPWVSSEVYEDVVKKLLGEKAINAAKDAEEGQFADAQIVWGLIIDAKQERMSLPESRVTKGAYLLNASEFSYGEKALTLKDLQRFRGIATGWSVIVKGLKNELKAAAVFLGGVEGGAKIRPSAKALGDQGEAVAWEDLWSLFEDCRWLCARSETWSEKFGGDIRELLGPIMERLALPGQMEKAAVFVSSDATLDVIGAIDWTHRYACREEMEVLKPWVLAALNEEEAKGDGQKLAIHIGEMLSFVAFACKVGPHWSGKVVIYGGDNKIVYSWIMTRKSGVRAGRLLIRVLNLVEMRFRCRVLGGWWRTFHNEDADAITRLSKEDAEELMRRKGWTEVDIKESIKHALEDTARFGLCFLSWADQEDRWEKMRLQELRVFRAIHRQPRAVTGLTIIEWCQSMREVKDFEYYNSQGEKLSVVVAASIGPDPRGGLVRKYWDFVNSEQCDVVILEGPGEVAWETASRLAAKAGWTVTIIDYLTSELGEAMVRRRRALLAYRGSDRSEEIEGCLARAVTAPSAGSFLAQGKPENYKEFKHYEEAMGQGNHAMLPVVGAHVWFPEAEERKNVYRLSGPCRWPLAAGNGVEELYVVDKGAPTGQVRKLTGKEIWLTQGRQIAEWEELTARVGEEAAVKEGSKATGRKTALCLLVVAAELAAREDGGQKAGMCHDAEDYKSLGQTTPMATKMEEGRVWKSGTRPEGRGGHYGADLALG